MNCSVVLVSAGLLFLCDVASLRATDVSFNAPREFIFGNARGVAMGDFNTDSRPDLAVCVSDRIIFLMSQRATLSIPLGPYVSVPAAADFNADGRTDVVAFNIDGSTMAVLLSNGDGTFREPLTSPFPFVLNYPATADFNGDGWPDLAVIGTGPWQIRLLLGNGDGTFQPPLAVNTGDQPFAIAAGDVNGDGNADLATHTLSWTEVATMMVLSGNGDGTFRQTETLETVSPETRIALADMNLDGRADVLFPGGYSGGGYQIAVALANADGTLLPPILYPTSLLPRVIVAGDLNLDGKPDVAAGEFESANILLNVGDGTLGPAAKCRMPTHNWLAIADFDLDGNPDLAGTDGRRLAVRRGNGDGTVADVAGVVLPSRGHRRFQPGR